MTQPPDRPLQRTRLASADLGAAWEEHAAEFIAWARKPGHDSYWLFHREQFLELVPPPGRRTLDLGCGEGRLSRDLTAIGHDVVGVDLSPTMLAAASEADPDLDARLADAADLPFDDASFRVGFSALRSSTRLPPQGDSRERMRRARSSSRAPISRASGTATRSPAMASR